MKPIFYAIMISIILLAGCTSVHFIPQDESSYTKINKELEGKQASIILISEKKIQAENIRVTLDSTSWIESNLQTKQIVPTSEIKELAVKNYNKGAVQGCLSGALTGACAGCLVGWIIASSIADPSEHGFGASLGLVSGGPTGALLGLIIGHKKGSTHKYVIIAPIDSISTSIKVTDLPTSTIAEEIRIIISDRVGEVIDLEERNKYKLFPATKGYQSAVLLKLLDGNYVFKITYINKKTGKEKIKSISVSESEIIRIREHINQFR